MGSSRNRKRKAAPRSKATFVAPAVIALVFGGGLVAILNYFHINVGNWLFSERHTLPVSTEAIWYAARLKNETNHYISVGVWSDSGGIFRGLGLPPGGVETLSDTGPFFMNIAGDVIVHSLPKLWTEHTYRGEEIYELYATTFPHKPAQSEINALKPNRISSISGPDSKVVDFLDGSSLEIDIFGPDGLKVKTGKLKIQDGIGVPDY